MGINDKPMILERTVIICQTLDLIASSKNMHVGVFVHQTRMSKFVFVYIFFLQLSDSHNFNVTVTDLPFLSSIPDDASIEGNLTKSQRSTKMNYQ